MNFVEQQQESVETVKGRHICTYGARSNTTTDLTRCGQLSSVIDTIGSIERSAINLMKSMPPTLAITTMAMMPISVARTAPSADSALYGGK